MPFNQPPTGVEITAPDDPLPVYAPVTVQVDFADPDDNDPHEVVIGWGDMTSTNVSVTGLTAVAVHQYQTAGMYTIDVTVTDSAGELAQATYQYIVVYDSEGGFVTGGGWIVDPDTGQKAHFNFNPKYQKNSSVLKGKADFNVSAMKFESTSLDWLIVSGPRSQFMGTGTINGAGEYGFFISVIDGKISGGEDLFRIMIWDSTTGETVYDNQPGANNDADPITELGGGSIVIHK